VESGLALRDLFEKFFGNHFLAVMADCFDEFQMK
jgi:hypothetical protein